MWSLSLVMSECSLSGREQFLHCGLREFRHSKSSVGRWYTQLDRRRFVYDTYKTMKVTQMRHGWVHMFATHRSTLTLQLHKFDLFRTCTALLRGNWQDFNWRDALRGPSAIAELLVKMAAVCHFGFLWFKFFTVGWLRDPFCIIIPDFVKIVQAVAEI